MLSLHCSPQSLELISNFDFSMAMLTQMDSNLSGFGDSTGEPTEGGLSTDALFLYHWVKARSGNSLVCVWGHSLGSGCVESAFLLTFAKFLQMYSKNQ